MSRIQPYSPMHPPQKQVSFERMQAILAKHAPQACEAKLLKPVQSPKEKPQDAESSLRWRKIGEGVAESSKGPVLRTEGGRFYVYDRRTQGGHTAQILGAFDDKQTALDFVRLL